MARDVILATWAVCAGVVGTYSWNDSDTENWPLWQRVPGTALMAVAGGGMIAAAGLFVVALVAGAISALL